jgi:hypothetical protein
MRKIPLRNREKKIVAYAKVDDDDYKILSQRNWYLTDQGYAKRRQSLGHKKSMLVMMHRVIMRAEKGTLLDHKNHDRLDNRKTNLRFCTKTQNNLNRPKRRDNTSGSKNVYWSKANQRWFIKTKVGGKEYRSPNLPSKKEAIRASKKFITKIHGEYVYSK